MTCNYCVMCEKDETYTIFADVQCCFWCDFDLSRFYPRPAVYMSKEVLRGKVVHRFKLINSIVCSNCNRILTESAVLCGLSYTEEEVERWQKLGSIKELENVFQGLKESN